MLFNSLNFILLIPAVLIFYWAAVHILGRTSSKAHNMLSVMLLTAISYAFFISEQPAGAAILFAITTVTYLFGLLFDRLNARHAEKSLRHTLAMTCAAILVLAPLAVFKYTGFVTSIFRGTETHSFASDWIIPLGISFFSFQAIGYVADVYNGKIRAERNFLYYTLFVGFFPQIASGPISKASALLPQIREPRKFEADNVARGIRILLWGYFLKAVFADRLATAVNPVFADFQNFSGGTCFFASLCYSLQIYGDFAGYSLMALGVGKMFGFDLINNFQRPYLSASISEFWRRWHISLSQWLRDYIYIPLGGSRKGKARSYANILATFTVSGVWHGANWTFILWGALHGVVQCVEKWFGLGKRPVGKLALGLRVTLTFLVANFAWIFFRAASISDAFGLIGRIFTLAPGAKLPLSNTDTLLFIFSAATVILVDIIAERWPRLQLLHSRRRWVRLVTCATLILTIMMTGALDSSSFIYVNF